MLFKSNCLQMDIFTCIIKFFKVQSGTPLNESYGLETKFPAPLLWEKEVSASEVGDAFDPNVATKRHINQQLWIWKWQQLSQLFAGSKSREEKKRTENVASTPYNEVRFSNAMWRHSKSDTSRCFCSEDGGGCQQAWTYWAANRGSALQITYKLLSCQSQVPPKTHSWRSVGKEKAEPLPGLRDWNKLVVRYTKGGTRLNSS